MRELLDANPISILTLFIRRWTVWPNNTEADSFLPSCDIRSRKISWSQWLGQISAKESNYRDSQDADGLILIPTNRLGRTVISSRLINETICQAADSKNINLSSAAGAAEKEGEEEGGDKTAFGNESREKKPGEEGRMEGRWKASGDGACNLNVQTRAFAVNWQRTWRRSKIHEARSPAASESRFSCAVAVGTNDNE